MPVWHSNLCAHPGKIRGERAALHQGLCDAQEAGQSQPHRPQNAVEMHEALEKYEEAYQLFASISERCGMALTTNSMGIVLTMKGTPERQWKSPRWPMTSSGRCKIKWKLPRHWTILGGIVRIEAV